MDSGEVVTKEFLEKAIGRQIESFTVKAQPETGNNFMSVIYTIDVNLLSSPAEKNQKPKVETAHYICKCYPSNPGRQEFLNAQNIFWNELAFYKDWIPELHKFQKELGIEKIIKPDFPEFVAGDSVNFNEKSGKTQDKSDKIYHPFENYIMMVDFCKSKGFKLPDRLVWLDKDHIMMATEAYAKIHALSWAYKTYKKIHSIKETFPNFDLDYSGGDFKKSFEGMAASAVAEAVRCLESSGSEFIAPLASFQEKMPDVISIGWDSIRDTEKELIPYFRLKPSEFRDTDIPWRVIIHGDSHLNNMLFRYDPKTEKPKEIALLDMQLCRESCPLLDLVNLVYTSTDTTFRVENSSSNINEMLELYFKTFNYYCNLLKTEPLPGFTLEEVKRRFNRLKIFGFSMSLLTSALVLKERVETVDMDSLTEMDQAEILATVVTGMSSNKRYIDRISALAKEGYSQGVI